MSNEKVSFTNVEVTAIPQVDQATGQSAIKVTLNPPTLIITEPNTIINYQLVDPTPAELRFTGIIVAPPNDQISPPAISTDGRNITLNDVNTVEGDFVVTFVFGDEGEAAPMLRGMPDVENRPKR